MNCTRQITKVTIKNTIVKSDLIKYHDCTFVSLYRLIKEQFDKGNSIYPEDLSNLERVMETALDQMMFGDLVFKAMQREFSSTLRQIENMKSEREELNNSFLLF